MGFLHDGSLFRFFVLGWFLFTCETSSVSSTSIKRSTYIIHMDESLMPKAFVSHHHWYSSTLHSLNTRDPMTTSDDPLSAPSLLYTYDQVAHGFSAVLSLDELDALKKSPGFVSAYSDKVVTAHTTRTTEFLSLNPSTGLWPASDFGSNAIIGVIDSGIWPESESFKDDGMTAIPSKWKGKCEEGTDFNSSMCNVKLIGARSFYKGSMATNPDFNLTQVSARDFYGHGTHVASIATGNYVNDVSFFEYAKGTARGVAPKGRLAVYRVLWPGGSDSAADTLAAMDQAVADGVDVLSISLGYDRSEYHEDPIAIGAFGAMEKGVLVSFSAGNRGPNRGTLSNAFPWALTVAAGTVDRSFAGTLTLGNGLTIVGWTVFPASALLEKSPLYFNKSISRCDDSSLLSTTPRAIIICEQSDDPLQQLSHLARSSSAGAIIISDDPGILRSTSFTWPAVVINPKYGPTIIKYAQGEKEPHASITLQQTILGTKPAPALASYSSRGPYLYNQEIVKPDLMAPGTLVLAAYVPTQRISAIGETIDLSGKYNMISGTSMACPHAAAVAALLKDVHPEWSPAAIRSAMMTTADTLDNTNNPIRDIGEDFAFASPMAMGSGQINPNKALDPGLIYDLTVQDYVNYVCYLNYTQQQIHTITRSKHYNCSKSSSDLNYPSFIAYFTDRNNHSIDQTFRRTLTSVGSNPTNYKAKVKAPKGCQARVSPKTLAFRKEYDKQSYSLRIICNKNTDNIESGSIVWEEVGGKQRVRSPMVVRNIFCFDCS